MKKQNINNINLESLIDMLASKDGMIRQKARKSLVALGKIAVSSLTQALQNSRMDQVRWEAAKALGAICDTESIPVLVKALEDSNPDVAWLAAKALIRFKKAAWKSLLEALIKRGAKSLLLRQGAHHVFLKQKENGFNGFLAILMKDLESGSVTESVPIDAYEILKRMKINL
jgi:HEAT repeat protein